MILERVEVGEVQIDDFLFFGAGRVTGLGRFRRRGRGLLLGRSRGSALARGGPLTLAGGLANTSLSRLGPHTHAAQGSGIFLRIQKHRLLSR